MSNSKKTLIFWGTPDFAVPILKNLLNFGYKVAAVVTQPEKPVGRARIIIPSPVKKIAIENHIRVFEPHNLKNDEEFFQQFKYLSPDLCVVAAYGKILPAQYLEISKHGFLNIHPSLLPKYRGPSPIQTAILNGEKETGVTIILMDQEADHGPILSISSYKLQDTRYYKEVEKELSELGAKLLIETFPKYIAGEIKPKDQDHSQATFTKLLTRKDSKINWNKSAEEIYNQVRALNPEPGTWTIWHDKTLNIKTAVVSDILSGEKSGQVARVNNYIAVATKTCYLILKSVQLEGGKEMDAKSFINGHPDLLGSKLG